MGILDWVAYGYPFASVIQYSLYNLSQKGSHIIQPLWQYLVLILAVLIFPSSLLFLLGICKLEKKFLPIIIGLISFISLHSLIPNKQERFILPAIPFILILGAIGWQKFKIKTRIKKFIITPLWIWFWVINTILLIIFTPLYGKKSRVEMLYYLFEKKDVQAIVIENSSYPIPFLPTYYLQKEIPIYKLDKNNSFTDVKLTKRPNYFIFMGSDLLEKRISEIENKFNVNLKKETVIHSDYLEKLAFQLNPEYNTNQIAFIYKAKK